MADATVRGAGRAPPEGGTPSARIGDHALLSLLGRGGMGEVWLAEHPTGATRALKVMRGVVDVDQVARFQREGEAQARVDAHPNVVRVHAAGVHDGMPWLSMELVGGGDLARRLERGPLDPADAGRIVRDLARGLAHAHARGVLHRDLKPANVLFGEDGTAKLTDFGLARLVGARSLTESGELIGTPVYMSPEQANGRKVDDPRSDVYGLGAVLYHALTGRAPFAGPNMLAILAEVITAPLVPPRQLRPEVSPELERVCLKAMARDPAARFASAAELAAALDAALGAPAPGRRPARGPRAPRALAAVACLAVVLALVAVATRARSKDEPAAAVPGRPEPGRAEHAPPPSNAAPGPEPRPASSTPPAPAADAWAERRRRVRETVNRPVDYDGARWNEPCTVAKRAFEKDLPLMPEVIQALEAGAAAGHQKSQFRLAVYLLERGGPGAVDRGEELLWLASRRPESFDELGRGPALRLAARLVERSPETSRVLLADAAERHPWSAWSASDRISAASTWLCLGGPGDLGRALELIRLQVGPELERSVDPAAAVLRAVVRFEGWGGAGGAKPDREGALAELQRLLSSLDAVAAQAARRWLQHAALVGDTGARAALTAKGLRLLEPGEADLRDLLPFDGSQAAWRDDDPWRLGGNKARFSTDKSLAGLREMALSGYAPAAWDLAERYWNGDQGTARPREANVWYFLAALDSPRRPGTEYLPARLRFARHLLFGHACEPDPATAVRWLEGLCARIDPQRNLDNHSEACLLLGLARFSGRGFPPGQAAQGLVEMEQVLALGKVTSAGNEVLGRLLTASRIDRWALWSLAFLAPPHGEEGRALVRAAAKGAPAERAEARDVLEQLAAEAVPMNFRPRARFMLGQALYRSGERDRGLDLIRQSAELGFERARRFLDRPKSEREDE